MDAYLLMGLLALTGLVIGPFIARLAAKRTVQQPVSIELEAERYTLASVIRDPEGYVFIADLEPASFVNSEHQLLWAEIESLLSDIEVPEPNADEEVFVEASRAVPANSLDKIKEDERFTRLLSELDQEEVESGYKPLLKRASLVYEAAADRGQLGGAARLEEGGEGEALLVRRYHAPSRRRSVFSALTLGLVGAFAPGLSASVLDGTWPVALGALTIFTLAVFSLVWALVDYDTMYLDMPTFWVGGISSWALVVATTLAAHEPERLLQGLYLALGAAAVFELGNLFYKKIRGQHGMGGGDTFIVVATAGVPAALAGNWILGYYIVLASMICAIVGWMVLKVVKRTTKETPFAFGPYLALGWIVGFLLVLAVGIEHLEFI